MIKNQIHLLVLSAVSAVKALKKPDKQLKQPFVRLVCRLYQLCADIRIMLCTKQSLWSNPSMGARRIP